MGQEFAESQRLARERRDAAWAGIDWEDRIWIRNRWRDITVLSRQYLLSQKTGLPEDRQVKLSESPYLDSVIEVLESEEAQAVVRELLLY